MLIQFILGIGILMLLTGCATTQQPSAINTLQIKVAQLEKSLEDKDQEISDLKDQVQELSTQVESTNNSQPSNETVPSVKSSKTSDTSYVADDERIIRVSASAFDVQTALKNAGYYNGPIDGKVGAKSRKAVADFQKDHHLTSDGIVGKNTWLELKKYLQ